MAGRTATETQYKAIGKIDSVKRRMMKPSRPHDEVVVELLQNDPAFADEYLSAALEEVNQPGGREALLAALRHIAEARKA